MIILRYLPTHLPTSYLPTNIHTCLLTYDLSTRIKRNSLPRWQVQLITCYGPSKRSLRKASCRISRGCCSTNLQRLFLNWRVCLIQINGNGFSSTVASMIQTGYHTSAFHASDNVRVSSLIFKFRRSLIFAWFASDRYFMSSWNLKLDVTWA